jgi:hypothetical protein
VDLGLKHKTLRNMCRRFGEIKALICVLEVQRCLLSSIVIATVQIRTITHTPRNGL